MKYGIKAKWLSRFANEASETADGTETAVCDVSTEETEECLPTSEEAMEWMPAEQARPASLDVADVDESVQSTEPERETTAVPSAQREQWEREAAAVGQVYDGFDFAAEQIDPRFIGMLQAGVPMLDAYRALHMEDILSEFSRSVQVEAEKRVTEHVQARGARPSENGTAGTQGLQLWQNVHQLTRQKRAEIAGRAHNGEHISFR